MSLTKEDMQMLSAMIDQKFETMSEIMDQKFETMSEIMDQKFETMSEVMDQRFEAMSKTMDQRFEKLAEELEEKLDRKLDEKLDSKLSLEFARFENRLMLRTSHMIDLKMKPALDLMECRMDELQLRLHRIEIDLLENDVIPRIKHIESCYLSTYKRYEKYANKMDGLMMDMDVMKKVMMDDHEKQPEKCAEKSFYRYE